MATKSKIVERIVCGIDLHVIDKARKMRVEKNLSQLELSQKMGLADGAIGKFENPAYPSKLSLRHVNLLAAALGCSPQDLLPEKPLPDKLRLKIKTFRRPRAEKDKPNYEILKTTVIPGRNE